MASTVDVSVLVFIDRHVDAAEDLVQQWRAEIRGAGLSCEFICVVDGDLPEIGADLARISGAVPGVRILAFDRPVGESAALTAGFRHAYGRLVLTLPAYTLINAEDVGRMLAELDTHDMVVGRRGREVETAFSRGKARVLNSLLRLLLDSPFHDLGSGVRGFRREVMEEISVYGDQHIFLPLLAAKQGFAVHEMEIRQKRVSGNGTRAPVMRLGRILDVFTIYFLVKFTKRPFRFFGGIGLVVMLVGGLITLLVVGERLFFGVPLADRPALILSTLMVVLGFQVIAVGLIGEIITFTYGRDIRDYRVDRIIGGEPEQPAPESESDAAGTGPGRERRAS